MATINQMITAVVQRGCVQLEHGEVRSVGETVTLPQSEVVRLTDLGILAPVEDAAAVQAAAASSQPVKFAPPPAIGLVDSVRR